MNSYESLAKNEIFSKTSVPHGINFFVRLDGWKFKRLSETVGAEKPFDERFAKCMVNAGRALFEKGFNPALIYVASDELNILFLDSQPFRGRVEKIDSIISSLVSAAFALQLQKVFSKPESAAFDSRIAIVPSENAVVSYLAWRQVNAWRNHNNAYAYWLFRKIGCQPIEAAKKLEGMKTEEIHETLFRHGINLAETPAWQRRGILLYKKPVSKKTEKCWVIRWKIEETWDLPLFTKEDGAKLIHQILKWFKAKRR